MAVDTPPEAVPIRWGKVINQDTCIGCHACTTACKMEHEVPIGVNRTYVKQIEIGSYPETSRQFQVTRCNQCDDAPCVSICPVTAMYRRPDGIVDFDRDACIGCKACMAACPYDAIYISPEVHSAEKCNFCAHRIDQGLEPACVTVCPVEAIVVGDLNDPESEVSRLISRGKADVRKPEKGTHPKVFYVGASDFTLNPSKSSYEGAHVYAQQSKGYPAPPDKAHQPKDSVAAARLAYDVPHQTPWHWEVSLYTWTKSIAAGTFIMFAILALSGVTPTPSWAIVSAALGLVFLSITGALLISDLEHPTRFLRIFTRPQWRSWLTRGSFIIAAYGAVLLLQLLSGLGHNLSFVTALALPGLVLGALTAIYTAFLFAQAKGRDLWQNPALPLHLLAQAALCGSALYFVMSLFLPLQTAGLAIVHITFIAALCLHFALVSAEMIIPHSILDAKRAAHQMVYGAYRTYFWVGLLGGALLPLILGVFAGSSLWLLASSLALLCLLPYEHAYVQAGQSIPLS